MKKALLVFAVGIVAAAAAFACVYFASTSSARNLQQSDKPELAWLREEFGLNDADFKRVSELHAAYLPHCRDMCRQVEANNEKIHALLSGATNITPEITAAFAESSRLRSECQTMMVHHFFRVSRAMPPDQGRRYLSWVLDRALLPDHGMSAETR